MPNREKPIKKFRKMLTLHDPAIEEILSNPEWIPDFADEYCKYNPGQREVIVRNYREWLETAVAWRNDRKNPVLSFLFLNGHPCFWTFKTLPTEGQSFADFIMGNTLVTSGAASDFWKYVDSDSSYMLECGNAISPYRTAHYHDYNMDSYADSFENCFVKTAKSTFGLNGFSVDPTK